MIFSIYLMIFIDMFTQNLHINISICPTPTQHFNLSNYKNQPLGCSLKRRKAEDLDLRPNPRKSLMFQAFSHYQLCTLVNRTTLSTVLSLSQQSSCVSLSPKYTGKRNFMCFRNLPSGCSCS